MQSHIPSFYLPCEYQVHTYLFLFTESMKLPNILKIISPGTMLFDLHHFQFHLANIQHIKQYFIHVGEIWIGKARQNSIQS